MDLLRRFKNLIFIVDNESNNIIHHIVLSAEYQVFFRFKVSLYYLHCIYKFFTETLDEFDNGGFFYKLMNQRNSNGCTPLELSEQLNVREIILWYENTDLDSANFDTDNMVYTLILS